MCFLGTGEEYPRALGHPAGDDDHIKMPIEGTSAFTLLDSFDLDMFHLNRMWKHVDHGAQLYPRDGRHVSYR